MFAWLLARRLHLALGPTVLMLLAETIPILTFVVERWLTHRYIDRPGRAADRPAGDGQAPEPVSKKQAAPEQAGPERGAEEAGRLHHTLARDHDTLGEYHPVLHHGSQELPLRRRIQGDDHPDTLTTRGNPEILPQWGARKSAAF